MTFWPSIVVVSGCDFTCKDGYTCVTKNRTCDGISDCPGGEDETLCSKLILKQELARKHHQETEFYLSFFYPKNMR